jgi:DNA-binding response OmpR family regulator
VAFPAIGGNFGAPTPRRPPASTTPPATPTAAPPKGAEPRAGAAPRAPVIPRGDSSRPGPSIHETPAAATPRPPVARPLFRAEPTNTEARFRPSTAGMPAVKAQVIVDDKMVRAAASLNEADFGDVAEEVGISVPPPVQQAPVPVPAGKKKVLVVDDEREIRVLIRRVMEDRGHVVVEADRGKLALQALKIENPDLIILDAMLPEVHGFDIAKRIRSSTRYGHIPIIMVSAVYRGWRFAQDAKQSYGVDAYLEKPFRVQELVTIVENALKAGRQPNDPERISAEAERLLNDGVAAYKAGDLDSATDLLQKGVALDPFAYRLRFHLGLLLGKRGMLYDAIEQLERAVQLQTQHFASLKNLAILYQQAGFRNKALEAWERALGSAPDEDTKRAIKEHIVSLL